MYNSLTYISLIRTVQMPRPLNTFQSNYILFFIPGLLIFFLTFITLHFRSPIDDVFFITLADITFVQLLHFFFKITLICNWYTLVFTAKLSLLKMISSPQLQNYNKKPYNTSFLSYCYLKDCKFKTTLNSLVLKVMQVLLTFSWVPVCRKNLQSGTIY